MFAADVTFDGVIIFPFPKLAVNNLVAFCTGPANKSLSFFTPCYTVEVSGPSTNGAHESPVPITSGIVTLNVSSCFMQRIVLVKGMN